MFASGKRFVSSGYIQLHIFRNQRGELDIKNISKLAIFSDTVMG
jgi:hypothetical protein